MTIAFVFFFSLFDCFIFFFLRHCRIFNNVAEVNDAVPVEQRQAFDAAVYVEQRQICNVKPSETGLQWSKINDRRI